MNHQYVLVTMSSNWADEFDVDGFLVVSRDYFEDAKARFLALEDYTSIELGFGTNQELTWSSGRELLDCLKVTDLSTEEAAVFAKHFDIGALSYHFYDEENQTDMQSRAFVERHIIAGHGNYHFLDGVRICD